MSVKTTVATYNRIAGKYLERWQDRSLLTPALSRFVARVPAGGVVLDVGCGPGFDSVALREKGMRVFGIDLSWGMLQAGRTRYSGSFVQADMRFLPLPIVADGIWCNAALLHLSRADAGRALDQFWRVLVAGGILFLSVKEGQGETRRSDAYGPDSPRYFTYWQEAPLDHALQEAGFGILERWSDEAPQERWLSRLARK